MALTRSSPGDDRRRDLAATLLPAAAMAAATAVAVSYAPPGARTPVAGCGLAALLVVALLALRGATRDRERAAERRLAEEREVALLARLAEQDARTVRLVQETLPGAIEQLRQGGSVEQVLAESGLESRPGSDAAAEAAQSALLRSVLDAVKAEEDLRDRAQHAVVNIARRVQALVHQQSQDLREMEDRHGSDQEVFGDLLRLDHGTALIGRLADSLAVLAGAPPGRQWPHDVPLFSVLRGAMSRVIDYPRVEIHSVAEAGVAGAAVEPIIHALAELLDNATRYSPPHTRVHLTAIEVPSGIAVEIEDAGVGLGEEGAARAELRLTQVSKGLNLDDLGDTPRLGLLVVGRLARANGFQVSLRPSAYAGVRAVLVIPNDLVTALPTPAAPGHGGRADGSEPSVPATDPRGPGESGLDDPLPQRRRGLGVPAPTAPAASTLPADPPRTQPGLWLSAFHTGVNGAPPNAASTSSQIGDTSPGKDDVSS